MYTFSIPRPLKKFILLFLALTAGTVCARSPFRFSVENDAGEPLPYAYIYVNNRAAAVTDSLGIAEIAPQKLHPGDTIHVHYLGTRPLAMAWSDEMQRKNDHTLVLEEVYSTLETDEVDVKVDIYKLLRKHFSKIPTLFYPNRITAPFQWEEGERIIKGTLTAENSGARDSTNKLLRYDAHPLLLKTESDTTGLAGRLERDIRYALNIGHQANAEFFVMTYRHYYSPDRRLAYLGRKEGEHIYRALYPYGHDGYLHHLGFIDTDQGWLRRSETNFVTSSRQVNVLIQYRLYYHDRPGMRKAAQIGVVVPERITVLRSSQAGPETKLTIGDPRVTILNHKAKGK